MEGMTNPEPPKVLPAWRRYVSLIVFSVLIIGVSLWLAVGVGGYFMKGILEQQYIKTTHGLAVSETETDPHIVKTRSEYESFVETAQKYNPDGIYERIHAGNYAYPKLEIDKVGQYTIETTIIYSNQADAETVYKNIITSLESNGYTVPPELPVNDTATEMTRMINATDEKSVISPGNDRVTLSLTPVNNKYRITFFYQSPELPLGNIPQNTDNTEYTVAEYDDLQKKIVNGELNICDYQPNGAVGGWYQEYSCEKDYL